MYNSDSPVTAIGWAGTTFHTAGVLAYSAGHSALTLVDTTQHLTTLQYGEEQEDDGADDQAVLALAWSPFGNAIAAAGVEGPKFRIVIKLWTFADDKVGGWVDTSAYYSNGSGTVRALAWSTLWGGSILASGGDDTMVRLWNVSGRSTSWTKTETESAPPSQLTTPKFVLSGHTRRITSLAFSIDGSILASIAATQDSTVRLWDTATGRLLNAVDTAPVDGIVPELYGVAWQVRGSSARPINLLAVATSSALLVQTIGIPSPIKSVPGSFRCLAWSPDGVSIATGGDEGEVNLWEVGRTLSAVKTFSGHSGMVESLGWSSSPAGTGTGNGAADVPMMLASGGADNTTRIWSCFEPNAAGK
eukprot:gene22213-418_t